MKNKIKVFSLLFILLSTHSLFSQTQIRDFKMGIWGFFPWVKPTPGENSLLNEINVNHIECAILNNNTNVYPAKYEAEYPPSQYDYSNIRWLEEVWFNYFDSTQTTENPIGTYVGMNGSATHSQFMSQIEAYAANPNYYSSFLNVLNTYVSEFCFTRRS